MTLKPDFKANADTALAETPDAAEAQWRGAGDAGSLKLPQIETAEARTVPLKKAVGAEGLSGEIAEASYRISGVGGGYIGYGSSLGGGYAASKATQHFVNGQHLWPTVKTAFEGHVHTLERAGYDADILENDCRQLRDFALHMQQKIEIDPQWVIGKLDQAAESILNLRSGVTGNPADMTVVGIALENDKVLVGFNYR